MARDDGDGGRRNSSSSSSSRQELTATASIPQFAPANSSGPLSGDDSSSIKEKKKNKGPLGKLLVVLGDWITWFFKGWAKYSPLLAAVAAPMSTLLDIPALAQPWYVRDDKPIPDRKACVALSSVSLALNVVAMVLLLLRFSTFHGIWQRAANLSIVFWILKAIVALCNLFIFGAGEPRPENSDFSEGFWCAVFSVLISGSIAVALFLHWLLGKIHPFDSGDDQEFRLTGRKFLLSVTGFTVLVGLEALAFSQLENWRYLDAIYFSIQTALTVGYGDITVQTAWGKVLLFIFAVLTLAQLGNAVSITIDWVQSRAVERRQKWLKKYSVAVHSSAVRRKPYATLIDEIALLHQINLHQESLIQLWDLIWALVSMFSFWCLGAMVFHFVESWGYGNALYSVMVMSFTIGYGDYTPVTAVGRVFWVCYALLAVPVVTNFAVQTVTGILYTLTQHQFTNDMLSLERERDPETFAPHSHFVLRHHRRWEKVRRLYIDSLKEAGYMDDEASEDDELDKEESPDSSSHDEKRSLKQKPSYDAQRSQDEKKQPNGDTLDENHDEKHEDEQHENIDGIPQEIRPDEEDKMVNNVLGKNTHKSAKEELLDRAFKSLVDGKHGHKNDKCDDPHHGEKGKYDEREWLNEPLRREQIEFYLLKQLIGRVTRLEAQARQMLIDSMDKDLAQTLLVADRNLQIRDAFQLYGEGDEADDALKESEDAEQNRRNHSTEAQQEHIRQLEQDTNLISGDSYDDDMLTRVRRYRSTFAEILVLSSTLLGLEGDDLKRFERWHIQLEGGSYKKWHHQRFKNVARPPHSRRKKLEQRLRRRNMDTEGKVRPIGYKPPGERDESEYTKSGKKKKHHHHHKKGQAASGTQSDTPHVDQAQAEGRLSESDANAGRLPDEDNHTHSHSRSRSRRSSNASNASNASHPSNASHSSSASHRHHRHKKDKKDEPKKKMKAKIWDAMEDELFRRTDKNVEDIIKAIPDEEEKEYLDKEKFARQLLLTSAERKKDSTQRESELKELKKEARRGELSGTNRGKRAAAEAENDAEDEMLEDAGPSQQFDDAGAAERGEAGSGGKHKPKSKKKDKGEHEDDGLESPAVSSDGDRDAAYGPNVWDTESDDEGPPDSDVHTDTDLGDEDTDLNSPMPSDPSDPSPGVFDSTPSERDFAYDQPSSRQTRNGLRGGPPVMQPRRQYNPGPFQAMPPARDGPVVHPAQQSKAPTKKTRTSQKSNSSSDPPKSSPKKPKPKDARSQRERDLRKHGQHAHLDDVLNTMNAGPDHFHPYATPGSQGYAGQGPHLEDDSNDRGKGDNRSDNVPPLNRKMRGGLV